MVFPHRPRSGLASYVPHGVSRLWSYDPKLETWDMGLKFQGLGFRGEAARLIEGPPGPVQYYTMLSHCVCGAAAYWPCNLSLWTTGQVTWRTTTYERSHGFLHMYGTVHRGVHM